MAYVRVWVCCAWVWYCEDLLCQVLAKKGEKRLIQMLEPQVDVIKCGTQMLDKMFDPIYVTYFVTCDLSYEHSCDLCSKLPGVVVDLSRSTGGS